jgi:hypothetical protein
LLLFVLVLLDLAEEEQLEDVEEEIKIEPADWISDQHVSTEKLLLEAKL